MRLAFTVLGLEFSDSSCSKSRVPARGAGFVCLGFYI